MSLKQTKGLGSMDSLKERSLNQVPQKLDCEISHQIIHVHIMMDLPILCVHMYIFMHLYLYLYDI